MWKTLGNVRVDDIRQFIKEAAAGGQAVYIGTDSLQSGKYTQFVTVVAVLTPGKGGRALYRRESEPKIRSLRERLLKEVWRSVDLGLQLADVVTGTLTIAIDPDTKFQSSKYVQELVGLVVAQGFEAQTKPDSWAATHLADHVVRSLIKV
jgi:predicted RNase H-related nuclease YkuK (DUF458 family)